MKQMSLQTYVSPECITMPLSIDQPILEGSTLENPDDGGEIDW